jgi:hypothetical protein
MGCRVPDSKFQVWNPEPGTRNPEPFYFTEYFVNAPPACVSEFGPSAA